MFSFANFSSTKKSNVLFCAAVVVFTIIILNGRVLAQGQVDDRPNILFILIDDVGLNVMESFLSDAADVRQSPTDPDVMQIRETPEGNFINLVKTPNIDKYIVDEGVVFAGMTVSALCTPTRASIQTGRYRSSVGELRIDDSEKTVAELLRDEGYQTAYIGKWHVSESPSGFVLTEENFQEQLVIPSQHGYDFFAAAINDSGGYLAGVQNDYDWIKGCYPECTCLLYTSPSPRDS